MTGMRLATPLLALQQGYSAMAVGVEKLKDSGYSGLLRQDPPGDGRRRRRTASALIAIASFS